jgi:hypothetical protein
MHWEKAWRCRGSNPRPSVCETDALPLSIPLVTGGEKLCLLFVKMTRLPECLEVVCISQGWVTMLMYNFHIFLIRLQENVHCCKFCKICVIFSSKENQENELEMSGIEPEAFRMRNGRSTSELHPPDKC